MEVFVCWLWRNWMCCCMVNIAYLAKWWYGVFIMCTYCMWWLDDNPRLPKWVDETPNDEEEIDANDLTIVVCAWLISAIYTDGVHVGICCCLTDYMRLMRIRTTHARRSKRGWCEFASAAPLYLSAVLALHKRGQWTFNARLSSTIEPATTPIIKSSIPLHIRQRFKQEVSSFIVEHNNVYTHVIMILSYYHHNTMKKWLL